MTAVDCGLSGHWQVVWNPETTFCTLAPGSQGLVKAVSMDRAKSLGNS